MAGIDTGQIAPRMMLARRVTTMKPPSREHLVHLSYDEPNRITITTRAMMPWKEKYSIKARSLSLIWDSDSEAIFSGFALGLFLSEFNGVGSASMMSVGLSACPGVKRAVIELLGTTGCVLVRWSSFMPRRRPMMLADGNCGRNLAKS